MFDDQTFFSYEVIRQDTLKNHETESQGHTLVVV